MHKLLLVTAACLATTLQGCPEETEDGSFISHDTDRSALAGRPAPLPTPPEPPSPSKRSVRSNGHVGMWETIAGGERLRYKLNSDGWFSRCWSTPTGQESDVWGYYEIEGNTLYLEPRLSDPFTLFFSYDPETPNVINIGPHTLTRSESKSTCDWDTYS